MADETDIGKVLKYTTNQKTNQHVVYFLDNRENRSEGNLLHQQWALMVWFTPCLCLVNFTWYFVTFLSCLE